MRVSDSSPLNLTPAAAARLVLGLAFLTVSGASAARTTMRSMTAAVDATAPSTAPAPAGKNSTAAIDGSHTTYGSFCSSVDAWSSADEEYAVKALEAVNTARGESRSCGERGYFNAVQSLTSNEKLRCAARVHAKDMAQRDYVDHDTKDSGRTAADRCVAAGYRGSTGEEIAAGPLVPPAKMVAGWLSSDGHCAGIMSSEWRDFGLAMYSNPNSFYGSYWALEFGVPL